MTYSILAMTATGDVGVGMATYSPAVGGYCPEVAFGIGGVICQANPNPRLLDVGMSLLRSGHSAVGSLEQMGASDPYIEYRQVMVVDRTLGVAGRTGSDVYPSCRHIVGPGYVCAGNALGDTAILDAMAAAYEAGADLLFPDRVLGALRAGYEAGGQFPQDESLNERSAVLRTRAMSRERDIDLRVDDHPDAVAELLSVYDRYMPFYDLVHDLRPNRPDRAFTSAEWEARLADAD